MAGSTPGSAISSGTDAPRAAGPRRTGRTLRRFGRNRGALAGLLVVGTLGGAAIAADGLPLAHPLQMRPQDRMAAPSWAAPFGADAFGRDLLSRTVYGARLSLRVAGVSVAAALGFEG